MNQPPSTPSSDVAVWRRMVLIPFDSRFATDPPKTEEEQWKQRIFKADPFFEDSVLPTFVDAYLWILIQYLQKYNSEGCIKPQLVLDKTSMYKTSNDIYQQFIDQRMDITNDKTDYIDIMTLYIEFKMWHKEAYPSWRIPSLQDVEDEIKRILGEPEGLEKRWAGAKMKSNVKKYGF